MTEKISVGVIFGGRSGEHEVSLMSAKSVLEVINPDLYDITPIGITKTGNWFTGKNILADFEQGSFSKLTPVVLLPEPGNPMLYAIEASAGNKQMVEHKKMDVIFPLIHGTYGEDGSLQGLLEMVDIAYVGAGVLGSSVGMDKGLFKHVMQSNHIPVLDSLIFSREEIENNLGEIIPMIERKLCYPIFSKPANLGSSVGISKCNDQTSLKNGLSEAAQYDRRILVEQGINGRDIEVSVLGNQNPRASIAGEIQPVEEFYSYHAKYVDDKTKLLIPAALSDDEQAFVQSLAIRVYKAIDCAGLARVDFLLDKDTDEFFVNEVNTIPGFTKISMYPKMWEFCGLPYRNLIDCLIELAVERKNDRDRTKRSYGRES